MKRTKQYLSVAQVAEKAGVTPTAIYLAIHSGKIKADSIGNHILIELSEANKYISTQHYQRPRKHKHSTLNRRQKT